MSRKRSQEVCPWNGGKFVSLTREPDFNARERELLRRRERAGKGAELPSTTLPSLPSLMRMTHQEWDEWTRGSAIRRAGYAGLKRNVAIALGNWGSKLAVPVLVAALADPEPVVRSQAAWALGEIGTDEALVAVRDALTLECDAGARAEMMAALGPRRVVQSFTRPGS